MSTEPYTHGEKVDTIGDEMHALKIFEPASDAKASSSFRVGWFVVSLNFLRPALNINWIRTPKVWMSFRFSTLSLVDAGTN